MFDRGNIGCKSPHSSITCSIFVCRALWLVVAARWRLWSSCLPKVSLRQDSRLVQQSRIGETKEIWCAWTWLQVSVFSQLFQDTNKQEEYRERQQRARERMQEDYARQTAEAQEREREKAQKRLDLKLGLADKDQDAETKPKRFDGLSFVREQIASKPVVLFSKSFCPFSKYGCLAF